MVGASRLTEGNRYAREALKPARAMQKTADRIQSATAAFLPRHSLTSIRQNYGHQPKGMTARLLSGANNETRFPTTC